LGIGLGLFWELFGNWLGFMCPLENLFSSRNAEPYLLKIPNFFIFIKMIEMSGKKWI
jgi:hypothetical protein